MKRLLTVLLVLAAFAALLAAPLFLGDRKDNLATTSNELPWQINVSPDGHTRVFGLTLDRSPLGEAEQRWGPGGRIALIVTAGQPAVLEAYYESVTAGFVTGRLILSADLPADQLTGLQQRAAKVEPTPSGARRYLPGAADRQLALQAPIRAIGFIPSAQLDETAIVQRFGPPGQRVRSSPTVEPAVLAPLLPLLLR